MRRSIITVLALGSLVFAACADDRATGSTERKTAIKNPDAKNPVVVMETSMGTIKIELDDGHSPDTVKNFLTYVDDKHYDGTLFHRVIADFMIQGGGYKPELRNAKNVKDIKDSEKTTRGPIKNEAPNDLTNVRGSIAMARTNARDSATAQFFINVKDNPFLDNPQSPYCVFGKVIDGMDVVDKIRKVKTTRLAVPGAPMGDVPDENVVIKSVRRAEKK